MIWDLVTFCYNLANDLIVSRMNKKIHNFTLDGLIGDESDIPRIRELTEQSLTTMMRDGGYVPVLDLIPQFHVNYLRESETFEFVLTMFGVYVGKKKSWEIEGFSGQTFYNKA